MRWLYHALSRDAYAALSYPYVPEGFTRDGFVHLSYAPSIRESARLYVGEDAVVLRVDPRRLDAALEIVETPRGPMPHLLGAIPRDAVIEAVPLGELDDARLPDRLLGSRVGLGWPPEP